MDIVPLSPCQPLPICRPPPSTTIANMRRRQNRIPGRLASAALPSNLSIAMSIWAGRAWTAGEVAMSAGGERKVRHDGLLRLRGGCGGEATTDDGTPRCVKLADKSDMMTTYRARQRAGNDMDWSSPLFQVVMSCLANTVSRRQHVSRV